MAGRFVFPSFILGDSSRDSIRETPGSTSRPGGRFGLPSSIDQGPCFAPGYIFVGVTILLCIQGPPVPSPLKNPASPPLNISSHPHVCLTPLESTLVRRLISVDSKALTEALNPLESTLTRKQRGMQEQGEASQ